jgi:hypothetical protein
MKGRATQWRMWQLLIFAAVIVWVFARTAMAAFALPWTWNSNQSLFAWLLLCLGLLLSVWVTVWLRGGNEAVGVRWKRTLERTDTPMNRLLTWIGIVLALVFVFYTARHRIF